MRIKNVIWLVCTFFITTAIIYPQEASCISGSRWVNWQNAAFFREPNSVADNVINVNSCSGSDYNKIVAAVNNSNYLSVMTVHSQNTEVDSSKVFKNMVFLGGNYSQFKTTDGVGKTGLNFGFYRQSHLWKQFYLNYGIIYTKKRIDLLDKKIRWSYEYEYSEDTDIHLNYNILELNILGSYAFRVSKESQISLVVGVGYGIFITPKSDIDAGEVLMQDKPVEEYDYECAFTDLGGITPKLIGNLGIKLSMSRYYGMLIYTDYFKALDAAETRADLVLNEKIHSFNAVMGVYF